MGRIIKRFGFLKMNKKLKIKFNDIKDAIDDGSFDNYYFIDKMNHKIVFISAYEEDYENKLKNLENNNFIKIPFLTTGDILNMMQSFVYTLEDFNLCKKIDEAVNKKKPFRNFKELINKYPNLRKKWFEYKDKELINETMDWLFEKKIELKDKSFIPKVEIKELKTEEVKFPDDFGSFRPIVCMNCNNKDDLKTRYFEVNVSNENLFVDNEINKIMEEEYGLKNYGHISSSEIDILTYSSCPKCKSDEIFEDFK